MKTANDYREMAKQEHNKAEDSFNRCDTDGCVSQWGYGIMAAKYNLQASILENGGKYEFTGLYDLNGVRVRARIESRYNKFTYSYQNVWQFYDANDKPIYHKTIAAYPVRTTTMENKGYREQKETVNAHAEIGDNGFGLSGTAYAIAVRDDKGYPEDAKVVYPNIK